MLEFLDEELSDQERTTFRKIVSQHFGARAETIDSAALVKRVISWIEADARANAEKGTGEPNAD